MHVLFSVISPLLKYLRINQLTWLMPNSTATLRHLFFVYPFSFTIG